MALRRKPRGECELFPGFTDVVEIGTGSIATVYRARESETNRRVALKLLNVRDVSPRALESFQRESVALGELSSHPNIVTLYRTFPTADGRPVLVLELCAGSVGDRLRGGLGMPVPEAVAVGIKVAGALETAHRAQILHRDVKPQNILVTEFGEPALADFGVAMLQSSTQTTAGLFDFTTLHAAPELLEGGETSAATDVYELASTLYQLIAGQSAFRAYDGESPASVILRILRDPVRPVLADGVPVQLSDLLIWAMSKEKDKRPPTAAEFAAELAHIEIAQGWPRTQFLIRDPAGVVRMPEAVGRTADLPPRPVPAPVRPAPPPLQPPARVVPPSHPAPVVTAPQAAPVEVVLPKAVPVAPRVRVPPPAPPGPLAPPRAPEPPRPPAPPPAPQPLGAPGPLGAPESPPVQYPIPPAAAAAGDGPAEADVPRWVARTAVPTPDPGAVGDLSLDPESLHRRCTVRSGLSALTVDDEYVTLRNGLRRIRLPWRDVLGFEAQLHQRDARGSSPSASLVALTVAGPVELPATRRPVAELRDLHALLDAYRFRARASG